MNKIERELLQATSRRARSKREPDWQYHSRLAAAAADLSNKEWDRLSDKAKQWANAAVTALNDIPGFLSRPDPKALVQQHLENISSEVLGEDTEIISEFVRGKTGIYALYNQGHLYYVGLAEDLLSRVKQHLKDSHAGKWDRFSVYLTLPEFRKDLETLLIHVARPHLDGCGNDGNFVGSENLSRQVKTKFNHKQQERWNEWFRRGTRPARE